MTEILKLTYGIHPKTEKLRIRLGRWSRGELSSRELDTLISEETVQYQAMARKLGITLFTDPLFNWYDIFRPLSILSGGVELGPLTRYGETNTFYRLPELRGRLENKIDPAGFTELEDNPPLPLYHVDQGRDQLAFVPGPETFFHFCGNIRGLGFGEFAKELGNYYLSVLSKFRFRKIFVFESVPLTHADLSPFYSSVKPEDTVMFVRGSLDRKSLTSIKGKFHSVVTVSAGNNLELAKEHSIIPGIALIDAHNTRLEDATALQKTLENEADKNGIDKIYLTHNNYLDFLPRQIADRKLELLGAVGE